MGVKGKLTSDEADESSLDYGNFVFGLVLRPELLNIVSVLLWIWLMADIFRVLWECLGVEQVF